MILMTTFGLLGNFVFQIFIALVISSIGAAQSLSKLHPTQPEDTPLENPVSVQLHLTPSSVAAGESTQLSIDLTLSKDHHAYVDMLKLKWLTNDGSRLGDLKAEPIHPFDDPFSKKRRQALEDQGTVSAPLYLSSQLKPDSYQGQVAFTYQVCSQKYCLFPKTLILDVPYKILQPALTPTDSSPPHQTQDPLLKKLQQGKLWAFLFVFIAGLLTSLTPCVFPMIPITISIIGARSHEHRRLHSFFLSCCYVLGIALTYSILGVVAALTGSFFGSALSHIWVVGFVSVVFFLMGISSLGFFEVQMPAFLRNKVGHSATGSGMPGAFVAGLFAGIVASPCVGPVLVSILTFVAQTAQVVFGFFLLFTFALGLGILFILLGTFSGLVSKLPRSGPWMEGTKTLFALIFFAMGLYYLKPHISEKTLFILSGITLMTMALVRGDFIKLKPWHRSHWRQLMWLVVFGVGFSGITLGFRSHTSPLKTASKPKEILPWKKFDDTILAQAQKNRTPVIVDFYADWCVACHELEADTYVDPVVTNQMGNFIWLKVDATHQNDFIKSLQKRYNIVGLPTVLFINGRGQVRSDLTVTGFIKGIPFREKMDILLSDL